jgi:hypothetical protein
VKKLIEVDELYPFFTLSSGVAQDGRRVAEFTDLEIADFERVSTEWDAWQDILRERSGYDTELKPRL